MTQSLDLDLMLDVRLEIWQAVPETLEAMEQWDPDDRLEFLYELAPEENMLGFLAEQAARGMMTPAQLDRFAEVEALVAARRAVLDAYPTGSRLPSQEKTAPATGGG